MKKNETSKTIAICAAGISNDYNNMFLKAFHKYADVYNFRLLYFYSFSNLYQGDSHDKGEANIFELINHSAIDGLILLHETFKDRFNNLGNRKPVADTIIEKAHQHGVPVVCIDHHVDGCYNISFNYDKAMEEIITHFVEHHHFTRINFVAGIKGNEFSEHRLNIFRRIMAEHNIPLEEERIGYGEFWSDPTNKVMDDFLASDLPMPEAIVCANDTMAITVYQRLVEAGYRVPEHVTLSGFDGIEEALSHVPSLTTARHNYNKTGQTAFDILTQCFHDETPLSDYYIDSEIIIGQSCGCVRSTPNAGNQLIHSLYNRNDHNNDFLCRQINMTAAMTDNNSFDDIFNNIKQFIIDIPVRKIWICIANDFVSSTTQFDKDSSQMRTSVYSRQMEVLLHKQDYDFISLPNFNVSQMLPDLEDAFDGNNNILFMPLHVHDHTIGYFAMIYDPNYIQFYEMYTFTMNIANALEATKTHIQQQKIIQALEDKYIHDPMTNLYNRRGFYQKLTPLYEECVREKRRMMVISIDLNGLKPINDTYGHAEGDNAIITVAKALISISMKDEICARFGGDEYVVAGVVDEDDSYIDEYTQKFQSYLDYYNQHSNKDYSVSASLGMVVCVPNKEQTLDQCIKEADDKMYAIKAKHHLCRSR